jgi:putative hydrolase of the HAD superfamily
MTWLLCDYGEVLCLAPSDAEREALSAAAGWDPSRGDFWAAYWADRPAYDRGDLSVNDYWARLLGHPPPRHQLDD